MNKHAQPNGRYKDTQTVCIEMISLSGVLTPPLLGVLLNFPPINLCLYGTAVHFVIIFAIHRCYRIYFPREVPSSFYSFS